jgi:ParB-like chromosome segregation protein Spo0J
VPKAFPPKIRQIADSIAAFGFLVPILIDEGGLVIAGHGRYAAARLLGLAQVPVIEVQGLSEARRCALAIAWLDQAALMTSHDTQHRRTRCCR